MNVAREGISRQHPGTALTKTQSDGAQARAAGPAASRGSAADMNAAATSGPRFKPMCPELISAREPPCGQRRFWGQASAATPGRSIKSSSRGF